MFFGIMKKRNITTFSILIIMVAIILSARTFSKMTVLRLDSVHSSTAANQRMTAPESKMNQPLPFYTSIVKRNLFNLRTGADIEPEQLPIEALNRTELKLKLLGTVTGDISKTYAIIEETKNKIHNLYKVGDTVQNATLKNISRGKVVLSVNGHDEILEMEIAQSSTKTGPPPETTGINFLQNRTLKRISIEDAFRNTDEFLEREEMRNNPKSVKLSKAAGEIISQNTPLKRIKATDAFEGILD